MDLEQLRAFVAVATEGGFTHASQKLHRTQPAVSRRVQLLEKSLGVELFARRGRFVELSPEGEALLPFVESALATLNDGVSLVNGSLGAHACPPLSIAAVGTLADARLTQALFTYQERFGEDRIKLRTATSREVSSLVRRGDADIGLRYFVDRGPDLQADQIGEERLCLVVGSKHRLSGRSRVSPRSLSGEQWLSFPIDGDNPDSFGALLQRALLSVGISDPELTVVDSITAQKRLVEAGYGIAFLPVGSCEDELRAGTLHTVKLTGVEPSQPIVAIRRRSAFKRSQIMEFLEIVSGVF